MEIKTALINTFALSMQIFEKFVKSRFIIFEEKIVKSCIFVKSFVFVKSFASLLSLALSFLKKPAIFLFLRLGG